MPGTVRQNGAELCLNDIAGLTVPAVQQSAPTWIPGLYWVTTLAGPSAPTLGTATTGGTVAAGTYQVVVTWVTAGGAESVASTSASQVTTGSTSTLTINSPASQSGFTGWYAYVTQVGGSVYTRQQTLGSPTAIGTNLTLTAPPTNTGGLPPSSVTSQPTVLAWNGSVWTTSPTPGNRYLALLTADPATSGSGGGPAVNISDLLEDTTSGYARQAVTFSDAAAGPPASLSNSGTITFGPYSANQAAPVQWAALVTASSGTSGLLLYTWVLDTIEQVSVSQDIVFPAGSISLAQQ